MKTQQHFIGGPTLPTPQRWREAFPDGQVHTVQELSTPAVLGWSGLLWLTSGNPQWLEHLQQIRLKTPGLPVVVLSDAPESQEGLVALNAGARGYTHAYAVPGLLQEVAQVVQLGGLWVGPELLQRLVVATASPVVKFAPSAAGAKVPNAWALLSEREAQTARLVSAGQSNKEVAAALFISERTVKAHLGAVFEKLGVRDRLQLVLRLAASPDQGAAGAIQA
ncbi:MAG: response regulator transcription factor [Comamonadaceae bacterium]|nr:response regulator transcription factor [Comamonadaceae bacterium]